MVQRQRGDDDLLALMDRRTTQATICRMLANRLRWVSITPMDSPVVPPVYAGRPDPSPTATGLWDADTASQRFRRH